MEAARRLSPAQIVDLIDFRHIGDVLSLDEALDILTRGRAGRSERERHLLERGYPPTRRLQVGWAMRTTRSLDSHARPLTTGSPTSS